MSKISRAILDINSVNLSDLDDEEAQLKFEEEIECPICGIKIREKSILRRHLIEEHDLSVIDACSILAKETPLSNTLPTLVRPALAHSESILYNEDENLAMGLF